MNFIIDLKLKAVHLYCVALADIKKSKEKRVNFVNCKIVLCYFTKRVMCVRVRFAPSPTGYLHIGGLRTALYNYLFARKNGGKCILRIEDTDRSRLVENGIEKLISALSWAEVEFDESPVLGGEYGPYAQSERFALYKKYALELIENGAGYYAFDTAEELSAMRERQKGGATQKYARWEMRNQLTLSPEEVNRLIGEDVPYVVRLKIPDEHIVFQDVIRGEVSFHGRDIDDQILLKSDGWPTYHLANVVDDHLMGITHVIRGEEWLSSTPKHILLYSAFNWQKPKFAHLPLLLNKDKTKLSKRQGDVAVEDYRNKGYFKEAIINFVALLGYNPSGDREIYSMQELIDSFELEKVNKGGAVFDLQKLDWMNAQYLKMLSAENLALELDEILKKIGLKKHFDHDYLIKVIILFRERVTFLYQIPQNALYMFQPPDEYEEDYLKKHWKENTMELVKELSGIYELEFDFSHDKLHSITNDFVISKGNKLKDIIHPLRLMITGKSAGAGMFETMEVIGKEECLLRISHFLKLKGM